MAVFRRGDARFWKYAMDRLLQMDKERFVLEILAEATFRQIDAVNDAHREAAQQRVYTHCKCVTCNERCGGI